MKLANIFLDMFAAVFIRWLHQILLFSLTLILPKQTSNISHNTIGLEPGSCNVLSHLPMNPQKVLLPPFLIKLELVNDLIRTINKEGN